MHLNKSIYHSYVCSYSYKNLFTKIKKCTLIYIQCIILETGSVSSSMATVTIGGLNCGVTSTYFKYHVL